MNPSIDTLNQKLKEIEALPKTDEHQIYDAIMSLEVSGESPCDEFLWELFAFGFCEKVHSTEGCVFGPMIAWQGSEYPSISLLNADTIAYWAARAKASTNPVFRVRYAELVWVFGKTVSGKADASCVPIFVESVLEMLQNGRYSDEYDLWCFDKLVRAFCYSISINQNELVKKVKSTIIALDENNFLPWENYCFDALVHDNRKHLTGGEESDITERLRSRFDQAVAENDRIRVENMAERLADYYRGKNDLENCRDIVTRFCSVMEHWAEKVSSKMVAYFGYQKAAEFAKCYQFKDVEEKFLKLVRDTSPQVVKEMRPVSIPMQVDRQELEKFYESFLQGDKTEAFRRIAAHFMRPKAFYTDQVKKLDQQYVTRQIFSTQLLNHDGLQTANINPDDEEGKAIFEAKEILQYTALFLQGVLQRVIDKYNLDSDGFVDYLSQCPLFSDNRGILQLGFEHYRNNDYCSAVHLFIPQIERIIREIVYSCGASTLKPRDGGGYHQQTLDTLLRSQLLRDFWKGEDVPWYLRVVLTDQRGLNLRNEVCHGLRPYGSFRFAEADLLIHILLLLATRVVSIETNVQKDEAGG